MTAPTLTLTEFLERMIATDEYNVKYGHDFIEDDSSVRGPGWGTIDCRLCDFETFGGHESVCEEQIVEHLRDVHDPARVLAECAAKRAIVELHKSWPVLIETPPKFEQVDGADAQSFAMRASQQIAWKTEQQYREQFGSEPPTGPILRALASIYASHPDFDSRWAS